MRTQWSTLLAKAKTLVQRNEDGGYNEADLLAALESLITIDVDAEKKRQAKNVLDSETKPGSTVSEVQLQLPGMEPYAYEPYRMIRDNENHIIEQDIALPPYKFAESSRAAKHASEASEWSNRKRKEVELYAQWIIQCQNQGRVKNLTFGDFLRENGFIPSGASSEQAA